MDKLAKVEELAGMSDEALAVETARAAEALQPQHEKMAQELAARVRAPEAARRAGLSDKGGRCYNIAHRPDVQRLVLALRESARRKAVVTAAGQIERVQTLAEKAEAAGDLSTALRAEAEVSKLAGIYPSVGTGEPTERPTLVINVRPDVPPAFCGLDPAEEQRRLAAWHETRAKALEQGTASTWTRPAPPCELGQPRQAVPAASATVEAQAASPAAPELDPLS